MSIAAYISGKTLRRDMSILFHYGFYLECYTLHLSYIQMYCISYILKTISTALMHSDVTQQHYTTQNKTASHTPHHTDPGSAQRNSDRSPPCLGIYTVQQPQLGAAHRCLYLSPAVHFFCISFMCILLCVSYYVYFISYISCFIESKNAYYRLHITVHIIHKNRRTNLSNTTTPSP